MWVFGQRMGCRECGKMVPVRNEDYNKGTCKCQICGSIIYSGCWSNEW